MTAYEYMDLAYSGLSLSITISSIFIVVLSSYLVVAYTIGPKFTRLQVSALNVIYSIWLLFLASTGSMNLYRARAHIIESLELVQQDFPLPPYVVHVRLTVTLLLWLTSLWFMWSMRHPKAE
jgi:hypothetical protein